MIKWRSLFLAILCSSACSGQTMPDFSGVFYRTGVFSGKGKREQKYMPPVSSPLVLITRQMDGCLYVSAMQNGATSKGNYWLRGSESKKKGYKGCPWGDRAKFKHKTLLIDSVAPWTSGRPFGATVGPHPKQSWELSPDLQTLTIKQLFMFGGYEGQTYIRLPSLEAAMQRAESESEMNTCNAVPPILTKLASPQFDKGVLLGVTGFQQFGQFVLFDAGVAGPFFHGLVRVEKPGGSEFRKNGQLVQAYSDSLVLEIEPRITAVPDWWGNPPSIPAQLMDLRFHLKWTGPETRDLGDVQSELLTEPWPELRTPRKWYRLEVPAQNVPLTDNLEIRILSSAGKQISCISGHI
jgi:hypothetical protein